MKIRNLSKYFGIVAVFVGVFFGALVFTKNAFEASGYSVINVTEKVKNLARIDFSDVVEIDAEAVKEIGELFAEDSLPARYDSREQDCGTENGCVGRIKNQQSEGLCWAYAFSTVVESNLLRNGVNVEISPKHLDYLLADPTKAISESGVKNPYSDVVLGITGAGRALGEGGNFILTSYAVSGKYALATENAFFADAKAEKGFAEANFYEVINNNGGSYTEKLSKNTVFNKENVGYAVTDFDDFILLEYGDENLLGTSITREYMVERIKEKIMENGAVEADSFFDLDNCGSFDSVNKVVTLIDRGTDVCEIDDRHAMTLVGWDDDFEYTDGDLSKKGAFVVQNSSGEEFENTYEVYLTYNSEFNIFAINTVENRNEYGDIWDFADALDTYIEDGKIVYKFHTNESKKIKKVTGVQRGIIGGDFVMEIGDANDVTVFSATQKNVIFTGMKGFETDGLEVNGDFYVKIGRAIDFDEDNLELSMVNVMFEKETVAPDPSEDEPGTDEPGTDEPGIDEPGADEPGIDEPGADEPGTDEPGEEKEEQGEKQDVSEIVKEVLAQEDGVPDVPDTGRRMSDRSETGVSSGVLYAIAGVETVVIAFISVKIYRLVKR